MKYVNTLDLDEHGISSMFMERIKNESMVLEFGCAAGRFTKHLKEQMQCKVHIVEIEREAFDLAMAFAEDGICCDIMSFEWERYFAGMQFDYIMFADVLEHLPNPDAVLKKVKPFLAPHGEVLISIPNIGHKDILIGLYQNQFTYRNLGLLDNTHVHFWGYHDLPDFAEKNGFAIVEEKAVYVNDSEIHTDTTSISTDILSTLASKEFALVYQFFLVLQPKEFAVPHPQGLSLQDAYTRENSKAWIYYDDGAGYSEEKKLQIYGRITGAATIYTVNSAEPVLANASSLQVSILFSQVPSLFKITVTSMGETIPFHVPNQLRSGDTVAVLSTLSSIILPYEGQDIKIFIQKKEGAVSLYLNDLIESRALAQQALQQRYDAALQDHAQMLAAHSQLMNAHDQLVTAHSQLIDLHSKASMQLDAMTDAYNQLHIGMDAMSVAYNQLHIQLDNTNEAYSQITNAFFWKATKPLRIVVDAIKRTRPGYLSLRTLSYLRYFGLKATFAKAKETLFHKPAAAATPNPAPVQTGAALLPFAALVETAKQANDSIYLENAIAKMDTDKKRHILLISHELTLTGAPIAVAYMARALKKLGYAPLVISPTDGKMSSEIANDNIPVIIVQDILSADRIQSIAPLFDLCVCSTLATYHPVTQLCKTQIPTLWWVHEARASYLAGRLEPAIPQELSENIHTYCVGNYARKLLFEYRPNYETGTLLYYVPDLRANYDLCEPLYDASFINGRMVFALIGTLEERKAQNILIEAIERLPQALLDRCLFFIVGKFFFEALNTRVSQAVLKYPNHVIHIEELSRTDILRLYKNIDCAICTSTDDPMPITITEAMLLEKFIICSENTGSADILKDYNAGMIYYNNSATELAAIIEKTVTGGYDLPLYRKNARLAYEKHFSATPFLIHLKSAISETLDYNKKKHFNARVSIVIPVFNPGPELESAVELFHNQKNIDNVEIILVDSGTSTENMGLAFKRADKVIHIAHEDFSHSYARNLGASHATGDILLFTTQDAIPIGNNWLHNMIAPILQNTNIVAVSCAELCPDDTELFYQCAINLHKNFMLEGETFLLGQYHQNMTDYEIRRNGSLSDIATAVRRDIFEKFLYRFNYAEDLDLGMRLIKAGYNLVITADERILHGHNRPAGYYLKRSCVEALAFRKIFETTPPLISSEEIVSNILNSVAVITNVFHTMRRESHKDDIATYFSCLSKEFEKTKLLLEIGALKIKFAEIQDPLLMECMHSLLSLDVPITGCASILADIQHYLNNILAPYALQTIKDPSQNMKAEIHDAILKQTCLHIGGLLTRAMENDAISALVEKLSTGV